MDSARSHYVFPCESVLIDIHMPVRNGTDFLGTLARCPGGLDVREGVWHPVTNDQLEWIKEQFSHINKSPLTHTVGGSATNVARTLAKLSIPCHIIGAIGDDSPGKRFQETIQHPLLTTSLNIVPDEPTGQCLCVVTNEGQRTMFTYPGASKHISADSLQNSAFVTARHVHIEGYSIAKPGFLEKILTCAREVRATVSLDLSACGIVKAHQERLLELIHAGSFTTLVGNHDEMTALMGYDDCITGCNELAKYCEAVTITDGANGSYAASKAESAHHFPAYATGRPTIDTTNAGDNYLAGFLWSRAQKLPISTCAEIANLLAAHSVIHVGMNIPDDDWAKIAKKIAKLCGRGEIVQSS